MSSTHEVVVLSALGATGRQLLINAGGGLSKLVLPMAHKAALPVDNSFGLAMPGLQVGRDCSLKADMKLSDPEEEDRERAGEGHCRPPCRGQHSGSTLDSRGRLTYRCCRGLS